MEKYLYTIGEVADILGENVSLVRFWSNVETFKHIHLLVKVEGLTLEGVAKRLKGDRKDVIGKARVLESLKAIRQQLAQIREELS